MSLRKPRLLKKKCDGCNRRMHRDDRAWSWAGAQGVWLCVMCWCGEDPFGLLT